jgi:transcriptional regulator with XRE-family HTH domain
MTDERAPRGSVAALLSEARGAAGLNQSELAERAGVSRSRISAAEAGTSLPTMEVCLKLAGPLGIARSELVRALIRDLVRSSGAEASREIEGDLEAGSVWETSARRKGVRIAQALFTGTVSDNGDFTVVRRFSGCVALRPLRSLTFRDRVAGHLPPSFAVRSSPEGLGCDVHQTTKSGWRLNTVEFHRPWTPEDEALELEFETSLPAAFVLSHVEYKRRQAQEAHLLTEPWHGYWQLGIRHPFERLEVVMQFPEDYAPTWEAPTASWDGAPLDDADSNLFDAPVARSATFSAKGNEARLLLERPLLGLHYTMHWDPPDSWTPRRPEKPS